MTPKRGTSCPTAAELANIQDDLRGAEGTRLALAIFLVLLGSDRWTSRSVVRLSATMGVAFLAFSILLAVFARIGQATAHHAALVKHLRRR